MTDNAALDVAIGLTLMYLMFSLLCTVINELFATMIRLRAKTLEKSVGELLDANTLQKAFYDHGIIKGSRQARDGRQPSYLSSRDFAMALLGSLDESKQIPVWSDIETAVRAMPDSKIRDVLSAQITHANGNLVTLRNNVSIWFDSAMDRVSGIYKRQIKIISFVVGLGIALGFGADSIHVAEALWHDPAMRAAAVQSAQDYLQQHAARADTASTTSTAGPDGAVNEKSLKDATSMVASTVSRTQSVLRPLPLGWEAPPSDSNIYWWCGSKALGVLVTGLALMLGAPFWFDVLGKFINIRGTGVKPERAA